MFEIWVNEQNPSVHLVKRSDTPLPTTGGKIDWVLLGSSRVEPEVEQTVERQGSAEVISIVPFKADGVFGPSGSPGGRLDPQ